MQVIINEKTITIPTTLDEFTLGQRIDFETQYGEELRQMAESIVKMEDGLEKELEVVQFHFEQMLRTFAFFSGFDVQSLQQSEYLDDMAAIYYAGVSLLFEEEEHLTPKQQFIWQGEEWFLHPPELKHGSKMKFGEFVDAKQSLLNMQQLGKGKWESLLPLCVIYLHKKDEEYSEEMLYEGSERMELMKDLPMSIALQVGFFLVCSMNICISTLASSKKAGLKVPESGAQSITKPMAGLTS